MIEEHSTIGILVTTDGSVTELAREDYVRAEERVAEELKKKNKPYIVILNTNNPTSENSIRLSRELEEKYDAPVMPLDCARLTENNINEIMSRLLYEFPVNEIDINLPKWVEELDREHPLKTNLIKMFREKFASIKNLRQIKNIGSEMETEDMIDRIRFDAIELGAGKTSANVDIDKKLFYEILSEMSGIPVKEEGDLFSIVTSLAQKKRSYDKIEMALNDVKRKGYGIVTPSIDDLTLEEPEIVKQGSKFGVRLRAKAPSLHIVKADIETEVSPVVGSEKQSEELINYLMKEFEDDPKQIWNSNIFGKSLHELVNEGLQTKLHKMPEDAQCKLQETLEKIINEGSGGLICIIL